MARDGTGQYNLPTGAVVNATTIDPNDENTTRADIATALTGSLARDGQGAMTGPLNLGGQALLNGGALNGASMNGGPMAGFRNLIINGNPTINQRGYASGAATAAANEYTLDRWRVVVSGQNLAWTDSAGLRTVTFPAGGGEQIVEAASNLGGVHTLSWVGTATATVAAVAVANGAQVTLTGGANVTVRFSSGTASLIQLEPGTQATPFERRPVGAEVALCQRYFWIGQGRAGATTPGPAVLAESWIAFQSLMRAIPTLVSGTASLVNASSGAGDDPRLNGFRFLVQSNAVAGNFAASATVSASAEL